MKVIILDESLQNYTLHVLQRYMAMAELDEISYLASLVKAVNSAETIPEGPDVVRIPGPIEVVVDASELEEALRA